MVAVAAVVAAAVVEAVVAALAAECHPVALAAERHAAASLVAEWARAARVGAVVIGTVPAIGTAVATTGTATIGIMGIIAAMM